MAVSKMFLSKSSLPSTYCIGTIFVPSSIAALGAFVLGVSADNIIYILSVFGLPSVAALVIIFSSVFVLTAGGLSGRDAGNARIVSSRVLEILAGASILAATFGLSKLGADIVLKSVEIQRIQAYQPILAKRDDIRKIACGNKSKNISREMQEACDLLGERVDIVSIDSNLYQNRIDKFIRSARTSWLVAGIADWSKEFLANGRTEEAVRLDSLKSSVERIANASGPNSFFSLLFAILLSASSCSIKIGRAFSENYSSKLPKQLRKVRSRTGR